MSRHRLDITGLPFGRLRALEPIGERRNNQIVWRCLCAPDLGGCGREHLARAALLRSGRVRSCGCSKGRVLPPLEPGDTSGKLRLVERTLVRRNQFAVWRTICAPDLGGCGGEALVRSDQLRGLRTDCGCGRAQGKANARARRIGRAASRQRRANQDVLFDQMLAEAERRGLRIAPGEYHLSDEGRAFARAMVRAGVPQNRVAKALGVCRQAVNQLVLGDPRARKRAPAREAAAVRGEGFGEGAARAAERQAST